MSWYGYWFNFSHYRYENFDPDTTGTNINLHDSYKEPLLENERDERSNSNELLTGIGNAEHPLVLKRITWTFALQTTKEMPFDSI